MGGESQPPHLPTGSSQPPLFSTSPTPDSSTQTPSSHPDLIQVYDKRFYLQPCPHTRGASPISKAIHVLRTGALPSTSTGAIARLSNHAGYSKGGRNPSRFSPTVPPPVVRRSSASELVTSSHATTRRYLPQPQPQPQPPTPKPSPNCTATTGAGTFSLPQPDTSAGDTGDLLARLLFSLLAGPIGRR